VTNMSALASRRMRGVLHSLEMREPLGFPLEDLPTSSQKTSIPMLSGRIRPLAICVFRRGDRILVAEGYDPVKRTTFYRPLGGAIEFGERAEQSLARELREELDAEITQLKYLATLENIFTYNGQRGHEIVLVFDGAFVDRSIYERDLVGHEDDGSTFRAVWKSLGEFGMGQAILFPEGLQELIRDI